MLTWSGAQSRRETWQNYVYPGVGVGGEIKFDFDSSAAERNLFVADFHNLSKFN